jgi:predicted nuclease of predicted toxin-antitoxin system
LRIRFQADANLHPGIGIGLLQRDEGIDWSPAHHVIPDGASDPEVLQIAASAGRVLVSHDVATMLTYFSAFITNSRSPGVILVPSAAPIGAVIERLLLVWRSRVAKDLENQLW